MIPSSMVEFLNVHEVSLSLKLPFESGERMVSKARLPNDDCTGSHGRKKDLLFGV